MFAVLWLLGCILFTGVLAIVLWKNSSVDEDDSWLWKSHLQTYEEECEEKKWKEWRKNWEEE